jgi:hypothetical protein
MENKENLQPEMEEAIQYKYVVECKDQSVSLEVDDRDVLRNADDEIDCPLDVVLRKNSYSFEDLMNWNAHSIIFIEVKGNEETVLNKVSLNVNL